MPVAVPIIPGIWSLRIKEMAVEGTFVKAGDIVLVFDDTEILRTLETESSTLEKIRKKISEVTVDAEADLFGLETYKKKAGMDLEKATQFVPKDPEIFPRVEIIEAEVDEKLAREKIVYADIKMDMKEDIHLMDRELHEIKARQSRQKIERSKGNIASLKLLSPKDGMIIYEKSWRREPLTIGSTIWIGQKVFELVELEAMEVKGYVLERDGGQIKKGDQATVRIDAFPAESLRAEVRMVEKIARGMERGSPVKYFEVVLSLEKTLPGDIKPGMAVHFEIIPREAKAVPVIPQMAVFRHNGTPFTVIKVQNSWKKIKVEPGVGDRVEVVILRGLSEGDIISLRLPDDVSLNDLEEVEGEDRG